MKYFIYLFLFLTACTNRGSKDASLMKLTVDLFSVSSSLKLSEIASSVECIPLETNDSIVLDNLVQVLADNSFVYAADGASLYKFDLKGRCISSIHRQGNAPNEYLSITDVQLDDEGNPWVLSRNNKALLKYSWSGDLLEKIQVDAWMAKCYLLDSGKMLIYIGNEKDKENQHQLRVLDLQNKETIAYNLPIDDLKANYLHVKSQNNFSKGNSDFFYQLFNDTIYAVSESGKTTPAFLLDLGNKNIPSSFFKRDYRDIMDFFQNLFKEDYAYGIGFFTEKKTLYWLSVFYNKHAYWCVIDGQSGKLSTSIMDDICLFNYKIDLDDVNYFTQKDNSVIVPLYPAQIMDYASEALSKEEQEKLKQRIMYTDEEQNPVLLRIRM